MARIRKQLPAHPGTGELRYRGFKGEVDYEIAGEPTSLRAGPNRLRGSLTTTPDSPAPDLLCPSCDTSLTYLRSKIGADATR